MATRTTNKELNERVNNLEIKVNAIDEKLNRILDRLEGNISEGKSSSKATTKKSTKSSKSSPKATKCEVTIEDGQGRGQGKKFIKIIFDGKPTDKELKSLKDNGFKYFAPTKSWSSIHTDAKMKFAESLAK